MPDVTSQSFKLRKEADFALGACKVAREALNMWLELVPCGDEHESEGLRIGLVLTQIYEAISHLEKAVALKTE